MQELNDLKTWRNPVLDISDPLKQRYAEIVQTQNTHINGICPIHLYVNRRPIESINPYALKYRVDNFQPLTKEAFDRALNGIIQASLEANIVEKIPEYFTNNVPIIKGKPANLFCRTDLIRLRETDSNAVLMVLPKLKKLENDEVNIAVVGTETVIVHSADFDYIKPNAIRFKAGEINLAKKDAGEDLHPYYYKVDNGQYTLEYPTKNEQGNITTVKYPLLKINAVLAPYFHISNNIVYEGKYMLRLPYTTGASAWADKFYCQETDFTIQSARHTYVKEIRAKERCDQERGMVYDDGGKHINASTKQPCAKCSGSGYVKDDSPLGTIYVNFDKLTAEGKGLPPVIQFAEPPQGALQTSLAICDTYYKRMCDSLGLVKANNTNASAESKKFDYKDAEALVSKNIIDNVACLEYIYKYTEVLMLQTTKPTSTVTIVGEVGNSTIEDLLAQLAGYKTASAPPALIEATVEKILRKSLPADVADLTIKVAKEYDKLFSYSREDLLTAKALLGAEQVTAKEVLIHDTIIGVILDYYKTDGQPTDVKIKTFLDNYYTKLVPEIAVTSNTILP